MLAELRDGNKRFVSSMREAHYVCDEHDDVAATNIAALHPGNSII